MPHYVSQQWESLWSMYPTLKFSIQSFRKRSREILRSFRSEYPSVPHRPPQFITSVPHKDHTSSAPKIPQFNTKNPSVPPPPQFHIKNPSVQHTPQLCFCLRSFWCGTEGKVELRDFGCWRGVVLVWNRCVEVRGSVWNWGVLSSWLKIWNEAYDFEWFSMNSNYESFTIMVFN